jgi:hypothetical protein
VVTPSSLEAILFVTLSPYLVCHRDLHTPFKRVPEEETSPEQAMFRTLRKMARTGHADRATGCDGLNATLGG